MSRFFNINLDKRTAVEERPVEWEGIDIEVVITNLREAAKGLTDPTIDINADDDPAHGGFAHHELVVSGTRRLTDDEVERIADERDRQRRYLEHMRKFR